MVRKIYKRKEGLRVMDKLHVQRTPPDHHIKGFVVNDNGDKLYPPIYLNKSMKDIPPRIAEKLRKSLFLEHDQFDRLMSCTMSRSEYLDTRSGD